MNEEEFKSNIKMLYESLTPKGNTLEVNRNSKGYTWSIKIVFENDKHDKALKDIRFIDGILRELYLEKPLVNG